MTNRIIAGLGLGILLTACAASGPQVSRDTARLTDTPAVEFSTSGWNYTNTSNPFLLTPDNLTNAMIGVSRLRGGQPLLNDGPPVPSSLDGASIREVLSRRLQGKSDLSISSETLGGRNVVIARYSDEGKQGLELAFELSQHLVHVILIARPGRYFQDGERVARRIVETMRPL